MALDGNQLPGWSETAFREALDRTRRTSEQNPHPKFDRQIHRDVVDECVHGRRIDDYKQALERAGFRYYPAERLPPWDNGKARTEGEWRFAHGSLRYAMTSNEVCSWYSSPEEFWEWIETAKLKHRARAAGLVLP